MITNPPLCRMSEVIRLTTNNIPNNATATYHLLLKKLTRYNEEIKAKGRACSESRHATPNNSKVSKPAITYSYYTFFGNVERLYR